MKKSAASPQFPNPPPHLSPEAKTWWTRLFEEYDLSDAGAQLLLESALGAFDRWQEARKLLAREGPIMRDRFGQRRTHPAVAIERDSKATMARALKELHLDLEPLNARPGRPTVR